MITDAQIERALAAWFANTKHGWKAAMRAALEAAK